MKSRWLSEYEREQRDREAAAAATSAAAGQASTASTAARSVLSTGHLTIRCLSGKSGSDVT